MSYFSQLQKPGNIIKLKSREINVQATRKFSSYSNKFKIRNYADYGAASRIMR